MTDAEAYQAIENSDPEMGSNWLIDDDTVYQVCMGAMGGVAFRRKYMPGDYGYESAYQTAASGRRTLFPFMRVKSSEGAKMYILQNEKRNSVKVILQGRGPKGSNDTRSLVIVDATVDQVVELILEAVKSSEGAK